MTIIEEISFYVILAGFIFMYLYLIFGEDNDKKKN